MGANEFTPAHRSPALGRRPNVVSFQNIGHGLVAHFVAEITQRTCDPPISPSAILSRQLQDQFFDSSARRAAFAVAVCTVGPPQHEKTQEITDRGGLSMLECQPFARRPSGAREPSRVSISPGLVRRAMGIPVA